MGIVCIKLDKGNYPKTNLDLNSFIQIFLINFVLLINFHTLTFSINFYTNYGLV